MAGAQSSPHACSAWGIGVSREAPSRCRHRGFVWAGDVQSNRENAMRRTQGQGKKKGHRELVAAALSAVALAAATPSVAVAAIDIFVKLGDIKGESTDSKHKDEIDILSWSWGVVGPIRNSAKQPQQPVGPGQPACAQDISIVKSVDRASPVLFAKAAAGVPIPTATFSVRKSGEDPQDFLVITLSDVLVTSVSQGGAAGGGPTESVSFGFSSAKVSYKPQSDTGTPADAVVADVPGSCR
jgi:type VI secretion system secreted protein Hcp